MKKTFKMFGMFGFIALLSITACKSVEIFTEPRFYSNNPTTEFVILGEIIYESKDRVGYTEMLRAARQIYPECDFVIDVMVDQKKTVSKYGVLFLWITSTEVSTWVMRGTAIEYKRR